MYMFIVHSGTYTKAGNACTCTWIDLLGSCSQGYGNKPKNNLACASNTGTHVHVAQLGIYSCTCLWSWTSVHSPMTSPVPNNQVHVRHSPVVCATIYCKEGSNDSSPASLVCPFFITHFVTRSKMKSQTNFHVMTEYIT